MLFIELWVLPPTFLVMFSLREQEAHGLNVKIASEAAGGPDVCESFGGDEMSPPFGRQPVPASRQPAAERLSPSSPFPSSGYEPGAFPPRMVVAAQRSLFR